MKRFAVSIYAGEHALDTDDKDEAVRYWKENQRKLTGQVGVYDRETRRWVC